MSVGLHVLVRVGFFAALFTLALGSAWAQEQTRRSCGTRSQVPSYPKSAAGDCDGWGQVIRDEYQPGDLLEIPVVVHVIHRNNGVGRINESAVYSQIDVLNQDFGAFPNSPGGSGFDTGIRFVLADKDPQGNPHSGITYTANDQWFEDAFEATRTAFGKALGWDPERYLNVYVNSGGGALGYVVNMPWMVNGDPADEGVVVAYDAFGVDPQLAPFDLGRTATHEVGHYLGLEHTFSDFCDSGDCYSSGDFLCDTEAHTAPNEACFATQSCGSRDPIENYMNYTPDSCMTTFSQEQAVRMRCSLLNYRTALYSSEVDPPLDEVPNRWISHVTIPGNGFETFVLLNNTGTVTADVRLHPFGVDGTALTTRDFSLAAGERLKQEHSLVFAGEAVSHFGISGSDDVTVSVGYRVAGGASATAHVHAEPAKNGSWMVYSGERDLVFDGVAVINLGDSPARVTLTLGSGGESETKVLAEGVPVHGKALNTFDQLFSDYEDQTLYLESTQPMAVVFLRGTWGNSVPSFLFTNPAVYKAAP